MDYELKKGIEDVGGWIVHRPPPFKPDFSDRRGSLLTYTRHGISEFHSATQELHGVSLHPHAERKLTLNTTEMKITAHAYRPRPYHHKVLVYNYRNGDDLLIKSVGATTTASERTAVAGFRIKQELK